MKKSKLIILCLFSLVVAGFFIFDIGEYATLEFFKSRQAIVESYYQQNPVQSGLIFFLCYVLVTGLSLPAASILTLAGGAIFGLIWGVILVSFAATVGATIAFLLSRYLFREAIENKFSDKLASINAGVEKEGAFYLFTIRMVPAFPYFLVNAVMGLTSMKTLTYYIVSQLGMLPATIVYVNAGLQISQITAFSDILSFEIIASFVLLGVFPIIAKKTIELLRSRKSPDVEDALPEVESE